MRRTQLYLDEHLWGALHSRARREGTTISELVRQAVRDQYFGNHEQRVAAMQNLVGIRSTRPARVDSTTEVRQLRKGSRLDSLSQR